jgi:hypothetical protein
VKLLQEADALAIEDNPNVELLPRIALEQWRAGRTVEAQETLVDAEIAIRILAGVFLCRPPNSEAPRGRLWHRLGEAIDVQSRVRIVDKMCGSEFLEQYGNWSLEGLQRLAGIVGVLEEARLGITGHRTLTP